MQLCEVGMANLIVSAGYFLRVLARMSLRSSTAGIDGVRRGRGNQTLSPTTASNFSRSAGPQAGSDAQSLSVSVVEFKGSCSASSSMGTLASVTALNTILEIGDAAGGK
mmetsp:Transcript_3509/g.7594  ORF Transcript_3509/g.7594 Transcript_3509/m.7594 type:complete len:109 (+) Transcript_3509:250-576(+)